MSERVAYCTWCLTCPVAQEPRVAQWERTGEVSLFCPNGCSPIWTAVSVEGQQHVAQTIKARIAA